MARHEEGSRGPHDSSTPAQSQSDKFMKAAREAGCNESEAAFEETLKKLGKHKPVKVEPDGK